MHISIRKNNIPALIRQVKSLDGERVEYGIFSDSGIHPKARMPYANLLAIHELREDAYKRPVLEISANDNSKAYANVLNEGIQSLILKAARGRNPSIKPMMTKLGKLATYETKRIFGDTTKLKSNAPSTIAKKGANTPLVEFGDLKQAISFKIKEKGER